MILLTLEIVFTTLRNGLWSLSKSPTLERGGKIKNSNNSKEEKNSTQWMGQSYETATLLSELVQVMSNRTMENCARAPTG